MRRRQNTDPDRSVMPGSLLLGRDAERAARRRCGSALAQPALPMGRPTPPGAVKPSYKLSELLAGAE